MSLIKLSRSRHNLQKALLAGVAFAVLASVSGFLLLRRPEPFPPAPMAYGQAKKQFGELWLPDATGSHPVVVLIYGGSWQYNSDLASTRRTAAELAKQGFAVWNIEYRAIGDVGGGFPGTFLDVGAATDHLRDMAKTMPLDLSCVVAVGHSAGGYLALWLAARSRIPQSSPLYNPDFLPVGGVVDLAGPPNLHASMIPADEWAGAGTIATLIGAQARGFDAALKDTSPVEMLPLGVTQVLLFGARDKTVPASHGYLYQHDAEAKGEKVDLRIVPGAGHGDFITPGTAAGKESLAAIKSVCPPDAARSGN